MHNPAIAIKSCLDTRGWSRAEWFHRMRERVPNLSTTELRSIMEGNYGTLSPTVAQAMAHTLGMTGSYWLTLFAHWDKGLDKALIEQRQQEAMPNVRFNPIAPFNVQDHLMTLEDVAAYGNALFDSHEDVKYKDDYDPETELRIMRQGIIDMVNAVRRIDHETPWTE